MRSTRRTTPDENEPAARQSVRSQLSAEAESYLRRKSGLRTPLRDLVSQSNATSEPKLPNQTRCLSSKRMLTPLLNKMATQIADVSETRAAVNVRADTQPQQMLGTLVVVEPSINKMAPEGEHFVSDDVESLGLYSDFARSTPKDHQCIVTPKAELAPNLILHESLVSSSEVPETRVSNLHPKNIGEYILAELSSDMDAAVESVEGQETVVTLSHSDTGAAVSLSRGETETSILSSDDQCPIANFYTPGEFARRPSLARKCKQVFKYEVSANSPLLKPSLKQASLELESRRMAAETVESTAVLKHQHLKTQEKGVFTCEEGGKETLPVSFNVEQLLPHHHNELCNEQVLPQTPRRNPVFSDPDLPLLSTTSVLHQSSNCVNIMDTGPLGTMTDKIQDQPLVSIFPVTNEKPLFHGQKADAPNMGRVACDEGVLSEGVVGGAPSLNGIEDVELALDAREEAEGSLRSAIISKKTQAMKIANDNDALPLIGNLEGVSPGSLCYGVDRSSLKLISSMVNGGVLPLNVNGDPLLGRGQEKTNDPLFTDAAEDGTLGVESGSNENVMEHSGRGEQETDQLFSICECQGSTRRQMSSSLDAFLEMETLRIINISDMGPRKKIAMVSEQHYPQTTLPAEVEPLLQLSEWEINESLEPFTSENGLVHNRISQATPCEMPFLHTKAWNLPTLDPKTTPETVPKCRVLLDTAESTGMLMAEENALHSCVRPLDIGGKPDDLEPPATPLSPKLEISRPVLVPCTVTSGSPLNFPKESVTPDSALTDMRQSIRLSVSEQEANTSMTPVSTSALFTWLTPLDLLERSMNISATDIFMQMELSPVSHQEVGTNVTPISRSNAVTWTTPIMILEKSMNTTASFGSLDGRRKTCTHDSGVVTDSLLWNFSRERLSTIPRQELENRLENTLTVIEVLSRQLQDWQQNRGLTTRLGPSEQRDACIQTDVIHISEEQQHYYNLYVRAMGRVQSLQQSQSEEVQLSTDLRKASSILEHQRDEFDSVLACAEHFYLKGQMDLEALSQQVCQMRAVFADQMTVLKKLVSKNRESLEQRDEMMSHVEKAIQAQEAADACLADLEIHSSSVINELRRDLECEKELCVTLQEVRKQQLLNQNDVIKCIESSHALCRNMNADRDLMQAQCKESQELLNSQLDIMNQMRERLETVLQEQAALRCEIDEANLEKQKVCNELAESTLELRDVLIKNDQLNLENTRLGAELASLMESLSELETQREELKEMVSEKSLQLSARDESLMFLEQALEEKSARVQGLECQTWQMSDAMLGNEQVLSETRQEKEALQVKVQHLEEQQAFLQGEMSKYNRRLQQMAELKAQLSAFSESIEFIEQENSVAREENAAYRLQLSEMESQLKANLATLRERSYQWEFKKDELAQLQKERDGLQEELETTKADARAMLLKMGNEITDSSLEIAEAKEKLLGLMETLKIALEGEHMGAAVLWDMHSPASNTSGAVTGFCVSSVLKSKQAEVPLKDATLAILGNETSAFTKVQPTTPKPAAVEQSLSSSLNELLDIIADLITTSTRLCCVKREAICQLKNELSDQKSELQSLTLEYTSEAEDLKEEIESLKMQNQHQGEALSIRQQNVKQLQAMVQQQEVTVLQLLSERKEVENLYSEISQLKRSLQLVETEADVLRNEMSSSSEASSRAWIQEKILLQQDLTKLRLLLIDTENSKSEVLQKTMRHREILEHNLQCSEQEVKKLDNIIEKIRETLLSIPDVVTDCEVLAELVQYLG